jgi:putative FmdB family regulatory protein
MPIYDYRCRQCGEVSEVFLRGRDAERARCPNCGSETLERLPSAFSVVSSGAAVATTCCGRDNPCDVPPCSADGVCHR